MHLQHFAGGDPPGHVWTYDALAGKIWSATPDNTAVERHFYSGERDDGTMDAAIETHIAKIEDAAATTYEALLRGEIPGKAQERANFSHFLGLMHSRAKGMRRIAAETAGRMMQIQAYFTGRHAEAFEASMQRYEKYLGRPIGKEEREEYRESLLNPSQLEFNIPKNITFRVMAAADKLAPILFQMKWWLMTAEAGTFITSDNPLVREVDPQSVSPIYGDMGFLNPTAEITFPLSATTLLMISPREVEFASVLSGDNVCRANQARAAQSDQFLYASLNDPAIEQLARDFRDSRPGMKTQGFGPKQFGPTKVRKRRTK
jgi:hypothetical protein